jgi:hypothetical protein
MGQIRTPFSEFLEIFQRMTPQHKAELISNHKEFTRLKTYCLAKGMIEVIPPFQGFRVKKNTQQVKELKKVIDKLNPGNFKWEEKKTYVLKKGTIRKNNRKEAKENGSNTPQRP